MTRLAALLLDSAPFNSEEHGVHNNRSTSTALTGIPDVCYPLDVGALLAVYLSHLAAQCQELTSHR